MPDRDEPVEVTWIGNATALLRWGPFTLLTDPNFLHRGELVHLGWGLFSRRLREPALQLEDLPALDGVVLSHLHGDHFDRRTARGLDRALPLVTTPHASRTLQGLLGFRRATGLRPWEGTVLVKDGSAVRVTALPGHHARGPLRALLPPVMGSLLEFGDAGGAVAQRVYLTGDTLMVPEVAEIARRTPDIDLALVHLGGTTLPGGFVVTMDGRQGAELLATVAPRRAVPVHYDDYSAMRSPLSDFDDAVRERGLDHLVTHLERGRPVAFSRGAVVGRA